MDAAPEDGEKGENGLWKRAGHAGPEEGTVSPARGSKPRLEENPGGYLRVMSDQAQTTRPTMARRRSPPKSDSRLWTEGG